MGRDPLFTRPPRALTLSSKHRCGLSIVVPTSRASAADGRMLPFCSSGLSGLYDADIFAGKTLVEYVWVSSASSQLRSKTRVLDAFPNNVEEVPVLTAVFDDGSAQEESEVLLKPRKLFRDPFREGQHLLVLCDAFQMAPQPHAQDCWGVPSVVPTESNHRALCYNVISCAGPDAPAFAFEQEYSIKPAETACCNTSPAIHPYAPSPHAFELQTEAAKPSKPLAAAARRLAQSHLMACLRAGISISELSEQASKAADSSGPPAGGSDGLPGTIPPHIWSYKLGPEVGINAADQLWMSRFLMQRVSEQEGIDISFGSDSSSSGAYDLRCHTEVSTAASRAPGTGLREIEQHMLLLHAAQLRRGMPGYGRQLSATAGLKVGAGRCAYAPHALDVIIPTVTMLQQGGHWVDCRPAADADPYSIITTLVTALCPPFLSCTSLPNAVQQRHHSVPSPKVVDCSKFQQCIFSKETSQFAPAACHSSYVRDTSSLLSDEADSDDTASLNSEDCLIAEIDRLDRVPKRARYDRSHGSGHAKQSSHDLHECSLALADEGFGEYCSSSYIPVYA